MLSNLFAGFIARTAAILLMAASCVFAQPAPGTKVEGTIGVNKYDLLLQYLGTASGGDGSLPYRKVTEAMARKSIIDAQSAGIRYFRLSAMGYSTRDLAIWRDNRDAYWKTMDRMLGDLADHGIRVIPSFVWHAGQLPEMTQETIRDLVVNTDSKSYRMLERYINEFLARYRVHPALLFYEIGNELNLTADLDVVSRCRSDKARKSCATEGNYTTDEMIAFTRRVASLIRAADPGRGISSGHSFPRPSAQHLRRSPEFSPRGADWTADSREDLDSYFEDTHADLGIISVHVYDVVPLPKAVALDHVELISLADKTARRLGKKLFVGEFGGNSRGGILGGSFLDRALKRITDLRVPYAALWVWQYNQSSTFRSFDSHATRFNIEPGLSDALIGRVGKLNGVIFPRGIASPDKRAPAVVITWPLECTRVPASVRVHVASTDDSGIPPQINVRAEAGRVTTVSPLPYEALVEGLAEGEHEITAIATDHAGNRSSWISWVVVGAPGQCSRCCK